MLDCDEQLEVVWNWSIEDSKYSNNIIMYRWKQHYEHELSVPVFALILSVSLYMITACFTILITKCDTRALLPSVMNGKLSLYKCYLCHCTVAHTLLLRVAFPQNRSVVWRWALLLCRTVNVSRLLCIIQCARKSLIPPSHCSTTTTV